MTVIELWGRISEAGKLEVDLPSGLPPGEVKVMIEVPIENQEASKLPWEERPWTEEEIRELLTFRPAESGAEIVAMLTETDGWWKDLNITDSVAWVQELRRKSRERRKW